MTKTIPTSHGSRLFDRSRFSAAVFCIGLSLAGSAAWAQQDPPGRVGRIADTEGKVWIYDDQGSEWTEVGRNQTITTGDRLATDNGARAELRVGSTVFRLGSGTDIDLQRLDDERIVVGMTGGSLAMRVRASEKVGEVEVQAPEGRFVPVSTGHYRIDRSDNRLDGTSWLGNMRFEGSQGSVDIPAGRRVELIGDSGSRSQWTDVERDAFSDWVARDDSNDDVRTTSSRYVSPEMTGAEDLDRYGDWETSADYGAVWYPRGVAVGWAPYRYGRWAWVAPWGWTWVDDARWGFAPSHYGRWVYWRNRWGWVPGAYVVRPVYSPALVGWVGGGNVSFSFSIGGPAVGWVPLAPYEVYRPVYVVTPGYWRRLNGNAPWRPQAPTGPIMYRNRVAPGGVTVVAADVLKRRQPVNTAVVRVNIREQEDFVAKGQPIVAPQAPAGRPAVGTPRPKPTLVAAKPAPRPANPNRATPDGVRPQGGRDRAANEPAAAGTPQDRGNGKVDRAPADRSAPDRAAPGSKQPDRAAPGREEPVRAAPGRTEPDRAAPSREEPVRAAPGREEPDRAAPGRAEPDRAAPVRTAPDRAQPDRAAPPRQTPERGAPDRRVNDSVSSSGKADDAPQDRVVRSREAERGQQAERSAAPHERINPNAAGLAGSDRLNRGEAQPAGRVTPREAQDRPAPPRSVQAQREPEQRQAAPEARREPVQRTVPQPSGREVSGRMPEQEAPVARSMPSRPVVESPRIEPRPPVRQEAPGRPADARTEAPRGSERRVQ